MLAQMKRGSLVILWGHTYGRSRRCHNRFYQVVAATFKFSSKHTSEDEVSSRNTRRTSQTNLQSINENCG